MFALHTVLCPVDFSPATPRQVDIAGDLCRAFGARLILHHNKHSLGTGASIGWMWNADHQGEPQSSREAKLQECLARVPAGVRAEAHITEGPVSRAVLAVSAAFDADLIVLTTHGTHSDEHASITLQMLERSARDLLVLHEPRVESRTPRFASASTDPQAILLPTDASAESRLALAVGFELARALPIELHLLRLLPGGWRRGDSSDAGAREELRALVPADLAERTKLHVEHGDPAEKIPEMADTVSASCILMGELTRTALRRWFKGAASQSILQHAHCPVWYVPATRVPVPQPKEFSGVGRI
jgi:nucleotide-binding universal stress UspA family protein